MSVWSLTGELLHESTPKFQVTGPFTLGALNGRLVGIGRIDDSASLLHFIDVHGELLGSVGDLLPPDTPRNSRLIPQLVQGDVCGLPDGDLVIALRAPYRLARYSRSERVWDATDDVLPDPWNHHIIATADRYSVRPYPAILKVECWPGDVIRVVWADFERREKWLDIRSARTGDLIERREVDFSDLRGYVWPGESRSARFVTWVSSDPFPTITVGVLRKNP